VATVVATGIAGRRRIHRWWAQPATRAWSVIVLTCGVLAVGWSLKAHTTGPSGVPLRVIPQEMWLEHEMRFQADRLFELIGTFGWNDTPSPVFVYAIWTMLLAAATAVVIVHGSPVARVAVTGILLLLVALPAATDLIGIGEVSFIWQGRYGLPLVMALPALVLTVLTPDRDRRVDPLVVTRVLTVTVAGAHVAAFYWTLTRYVSGRPGDWNVLEGPWAPPGGSLAVLFLLLSGMVVLVWWSGWSSLPGRQPVAPEAPVAPSRSAVKRAATASHPHSPSTQDRPAAPSRAASSRSSNSSDSREAMSSADRPSTT
jgi:hypothetical protein